ncbi:EpsI family protein [Erythrobacter litoralis]|uniref:exosortase-associated protein EpsI, V-type n=1 Tax=Erythrobacter litoralis TaxID=39960 RepID=UPI0024360F6D|nr:exosortase-associated protein EpsI, V-type [Erythrobacter litoralis]MDG6079112.1 EpsI family protein [Erythrobacter litoralis]
MTAVNRRTVLIGGAFAAAFGTAAWLTPREQLRYLEDDQLSEVIPERFGPWVSKFDPNLVVPPTEGSLTDRLYDDLVTRRYQNVNTGEQIMLLAAYGGTQTDDLQLHRPEACYPAVGMQIAARRPVMLELGGRSVPAVELTATAPGRIEDIIYWSRMGNSFPQDAGAQRSEKLALAFQGLIPDGILVRASHVRPEGMPASVDIAAFLSQMVGSVSTKQRLALIGNAQGISRVAERG